MQSHGLSECAPGHPVGMRLAVPMPTCEWALTDGGLPEELVLNAQVGWEELSCERFWLMLVQGGRGLCSVE